VSRTALCLGNQSDIPLNILSKKFKKDIADDGGDRGYCKISAGKDIVNCRGQASFLPHSRALKFAHQ